MVVTTSNLVEWDPVLFESDAYSAARMKQRERMRQHIGGILDMCDEFKKTALVSEIRKLTEPYDMRSGFRDFDPYHSTVVGIWAGALDRALDWLKSGCDPSFLDFFDDVPAFRQDLSNEIPEISDRLPVIHDSVRVVPVNAISDAARFKDRVQDCLPEFPDETRYETLDEARIAEVGEHLEKAIDLLRDLHPLAYEGFLNNIHTIYIAVLHSDNSSLGSRKDCYGSIIAGLSKRLIDEKDYAFTASQLYHEHCHNKFVVYLDLLEQPLPTEAVYVSSFKNAIRDVETVLHTVLPISMECITLLELLPRYDEPKRERTFSYLAAVAIRLELIAGPSQCHAGYRQTQAARSASRPFRSDRRTN